MDDTVSPPLPAISTLTASPGTTTQVHFSGPPPAPPLAQIDFQPAEYKTDSINVAAWLAIHGHRHVRLDESRRRLKERIVTWKTFVFLDVPLPNAHRPTDLAAEFEFGRPATDDLRNYLSLQNEYTKLSRRARG